MGWRNRSQENKVTTPKQENMENGGRCQPRLFPMFLKTKPRPNTADSKRPTARRKSFEEDHAPRRLGRGPSGSPEKATGKGTNDPRIMVRTHQRPGNFPIWDRPDRKKSGVFSLKPSRHQLNLWRSMFLGRSSLNRITLTIFMAAMTWRLAPLLALLPLVRGEVISLPLERKVGKIKHNTL